LYWVTVPLVAALPPGTPPSEAEARENDTWEWWNKLRTLLKPTTKIAVALELTADLPPPAALARWMGEPVRGVIIPTSIFLINKKARCSSVLDGILP
jgi:protein arginine N-methyltransferase 5